jgi:putative redox protein
MIRTESLPEKYGTRFTNGEQIAFSDTTPEKGGGGQGFRPHELLEAALADCMNMTLRMQAEKRGIPLSGVSVTVMLDRTPSEGPVFQYRVDLGESLSGEDKEMLLAALENCPVRSTLSKPLRFLLME